MGPFGVPCDFVLVRSRRILRGRETSMKTRIGVLAFSLAALILGGFLASTNSALAHERRNVGVFTFVVGFLNEPALLNQPNSIDLRISHTADSSPVSGAEKTLKGEISFESQKLAVDLTPRFGTP